MAYINDNYALLPVEEETERGEAVAVATPLMVETPYSGYDMQVKVADVVTLAAGYGYTSGEVLSFDGVSACSITTTDSIKSIFDVTIYTTDGQEHKVHIGASAIYDCIPYYDCNIEGTTLTVTGKAVKADTGKDDLVINQTFEVADGSLINGVATYGEYGNNYVVTSVLDFSNVTLTRSGKNLIDAKSIASHNNSTKVKFEGESFTLKGNAGSSAFNYDAGQLMLPYANADTIKAQGTPIKKGKTYTISFDYLLLEKGKYSYQISLVGYTQGMGMAFNTTQVTGEVGITKRFSVTFTATANTKIGLCFRLNNNYATISNIQIEEGNATEFIPYVEPTEHTPNSDGTVDGVISLKPVTILTANVDGVTIQAEPVTKRHFKIKKMR